MKILMFISSLGCGGAERSLVILSNAFKNKGHEVVVVTSNSYIPDFYSLDKGIKRITLRLGRYESVRWFDISGNLIRLLKIRRALKKEKCDVIMSFLDGTNEIVLLSTLFWKIPKIISCQCDIRFYPVSKRWDFLRSIVYPLATRIVFLNEEQAEWCRRHFVGWKTISIPNPLPSIPNGIISTHLPNTMEKNLVAMGRLSYEKGFDLLIEAFSKIAVKFPQWGLIILGKGPLRFQLEEQIRNLGLEDRVFLPGAISQPFSILRQCDIFVFSSRYEGQGMALMEAMACGLSVISFDCPSGPSHIIRHEIDGILVPPEDIDALTKAMEKLIQDEPLRISLGGKAKEIVTRFSIEEIANIWVELFKEVSGK